MKRNVLNEAELSAMTAAQLKAAGIQEVPGFGGQMIPVNKSGFLKFNNHANLPDDVYNKLSTAWSNSNGDVNAFYSADLGGTTVKDTLAQCPSQQSYMIGRQLGLPKGTAIPCQNFTENNYSAIKFGGDDPNALGGINSGTNDLATPVAPVSGGGDIPADAGDGAVGDAGGADGVADSGAGTGAGDWWAYFGDPKFLIGVAAVGGVLAIIKSLGNTIKARFQKCAKVLYKMQKDFGTKENGMDMKAVLPGVGSKITDWITRLWGKKKGVGKDTGALGLRPFVSNYVNEISGDYDEAMRAYNLIAAAADASSNAAKTSGASDNYVKADHKEATTSATNVPESVQETIVYESFEDAFKDNQLNEAVAVNESVGMAVAAASLLVRGLSLAKGHFNLKTKDKNGNDIEKNIAVTKKSTREVCYAILNMFYGKYFDLNKVFSKCGINDFADLDVNNVEKFEKVAIAFTKEQETSAQSKMFSRVKGNYTKMVDAYIRIANNVVKNFETYTLKKKLHGKDGSTKDLSEKDNNLVVAAREKLRAELDRQKDAYENNFPRVLNAIVSSEEYVKFCDFIIKRVLPVFKTGLAGESDYALDILPKVNEYYVIRQTGEQEGLEGGEQAAGNVVLARVLDVKKEGDEKEGAGKKISITFARVGLIKANIQYNDNLIYDLSSLRPEDLDRNAFAKLKGSTADKSEGGDKVTLTYGAWLNLDPRVAKNVPGESNDAEDMRRTKLYRRELNINGKAIVEYVYGEAPVSHEGVATREFAEDMNISEAGEETHAVGTPLQNGDVDPRSIDENITKVICVNIAAEQEQNLLSADIKTLQFTGAEIKLKTPCSAKKLDEILINDELYRPEKGFTPQDGAVKQKDKIADLITNQQGYTHIAAVNVATVDEIVKTFKQLETRQTTSEQLFDNLDSIAENLVNEIKALNLDASKIIHPFSLAGNAGKKTFYTWEQTGNKPYYREIKTGINDKRNTEVVIYFYPTLLDNNGAFVIPQTQQAGQNTASPQGNVGVAVCINNHAHGLVQPVCHPATIDKNSITKAIKEVINELIGYKVIEPVRGMSLDNSGVQRAAVQEPKITEPAKESFNVEYSDLFNLAESFMGTLSYLKVNRTITTDAENKGQYYVLSENAWGDGIIRNPEEYLNTFAETSVKACKSYDDFTHLAKSSVSINFMPLTEDCSYKTKLPYNRFGMLTESNPLYESTFVVSFNEDLSVKNIVNLGISKIAK